VATTLDLKVQALFDSIEAAAKPPVTRVDSKPRNKSFPKDFSKDQRKYIHSPNWDKSGSLENRKHADLNWKTDKVTFGGKPSETSSYAVPRNVRSIKFVVPMTGKSHIVFDKKDEKRIRNNKSMESVWTGGKQSKFKSLRKGGMDEEISKDPGRPSKQQIIQDPVKHLEKQGHTVHFIEDLDEQRKLLLNRGYRLKLEGFGKLEKT